MSHPATWPHVRRSIGGSSGDRAASAREDDLDAPVERAPARVVGAVGLGVGGDGVGLAAAVTAALRAELSTDAPRLSTRGRGETDPVAPNVKPDGMDNPRGRARNRRVEVVFPR